MTTGGAKPYNIDMELKDIKQAKKRLEGVVHVTPIERSQTFSDMSGADVYLKCENLQKTGSFKDRKSVV